MECFGDIQKIPINCIDSLFFLTKRFSLTNTNSEVVITESGNLVTRYNVKQSKVVHNWSFNELNKLSLPLVVFYPPENNGKETLLGLHSGNILIEWTLNESNELVQRAKKHFPSTICAILPSKKKSDLLIVFADGAVSFYSKLKLSSFEDMLAIIESDEVIIGIESHLDRKNGFLYYITKNRDTNKLKIYKTFISHSTGLATNEIENAFLNDDIRVWTYSKALNCLVGALKKDKNIYIYNIEPSSLNNSSTKNELFSFVTNTADPLCAFAYCSNTSICFLSESSSNQSYQLQVFETKYFTNIGHLNFNESILTKDFCVMENNLFIVCRNNVIVIPVLKQNVLLSHLLTKNLTESERNEVKLMNIVKFNEMFGITGLEKTIELDKIKEINIKFSKFSPKKFDDIPEELIVSLFDFCTRHYVNTQKDPTKEKQILTELEQFFSYLVKVPFNEVFLVSCLKSSNTSFDQHLVAIEWLLNLPPSKDCTILSWISVLLDANFRQFIIRPNAEAKATLGRVYEFINRSIRFYEDLGPIKTVLDALIKREQTILSALSNDTMPIGQYSIELLSFT